MASIFSDRFVVAVYEPEQDALSKIKTLFKNEEKCEAIFFDELEVFKKFIELENVNIAYCDIDVDGDKSDNKERQSIARDILAYKKGTYLILLTNEPKITKLTTLYRLGIHSIIFKEEGHKAFKRELNRAIDHLEYWKSRFEQLLVDKSMARELDNLFGDLE